MASLIGEGSGRLRLVMTENCTDGRATCSSAAPGPAATCRCRVRFTEPGTARRHVAFRTDDTPALRRRCRHRLSPAAAVLAGRRLPVAPHGFPPGPPALPITPCRRRVTIGFAMLELIICAPILIGWLA